MKSIDLTKKEYEYLTRTSNKIRDLVTWMPALCGVDQHARWSKMFELVFDHEAENKESVFARQTDEDFDARSEVARGVFGVVSDPDKADYIWWLLEVADRAAQGKISDEEREEISSRDGEYPDVDAILKPSEAAVALAWSPSTQSV